jgi:hypothetical protein
VNAFALLLGTLRITLIHNPPYVSTSLRQRGVGMLTVSFDGAWGAGLGRM